MYRRIYNMGDNHRYFLAKLRQLLDNRVLTQAQISRETGVTTTHISMIVNKRRNAGGELQQKIADLVGMNIVDFLSDGYKLIHGTNPEWGRSSTQAAQQQDTFDPEKVRSMFNQTLEQVKMLSMKVSRWRDILESITEGIFVVAPDLTVIYTNRAYRQIVGGDPTGSLCSEQEHCQGEDNCVIRKAMDAKLPREKHVEMDGKRFRMTASPVYSDGEIVSVVCTVLNLTEMCTANNT